ncbi:hypothetical protein BDB00DRAFT_795024 [Zychaea mexicana]|uniref:uncharacterized protein n=1 Tax=Zychaea mexicana TaxID=64656 RepID=UPI0022FF13C2|nr:uncharacterized protein BDB00DRAFT_795024 [Zychaea mexicana]KAI9499660.1 hypothetical protein BDB00DRAFT_795024 [Zychaea mexicana]
MQTSSLRSVTTSRMATSFRSESYSTSLKANFFIYLPTYIYIYISLLHRFIHNTFRNSSNNNSSTSFPQPSYRVITIYPLFLFLVLSSSFHQFIFPNPMTTDRC